MFETVRAKYNKIALEILANKLEHPNILDNIEEPWYSYFIELYHKDIEKCAEILNARGDRRLTDWLWNDADVRMKLSENDKKMREELDKCNGYM